MLVVCVILFGVSDRSAESVLLAEESIVPVTPALTEAAGESEGAVLGRAAEVIALDRLATAVEECKAVLIVDNDAVAVREGTLGVGSAVGTPANEPNEVGLTRSLDDTVIEAASLFCAVDVGTDADDVGVNNDEALAVNVAIEPLALRVERGVFDGEAVEEMAVELVLDTEGLEVDVRERRLVDVPLPHDVASTEMVASALREADEEIEKVDVSDKSEVTVPLIDASAVGTLDALCRFELVTLALASLLFVFVVVTHADGVDTIDPLTDNVDIKDCDMRALFVTVTLADEVLKIEAVLASETVLKAEFVEVVETAGVDEGIEAVDTGEVEAER